MSPIRPYQDARPRLGARVYVDPAACVIGDVAMADDVSIWPGAVVRGDVNFIRIGARSSIQDGSVVHVTHDGPFTRPGGFPTVIGSDVTVGHKVILHGCTIGNFCLIGMGAIVLDGAVVEDYGFLGAGALLPSGKTVASGELWLGNPARCVRRLSERELESLRYNAAHYVRLKNRYLGFEGA
ncbi:MAG: gamma carbonic anhydrase family protein [Xanthomonadales bacterium]|nr:gamma carbonic anhydrase family protein [Xanthomonadales bacterium]